MSEHTVSQLISFTRDGEWGQGEPGPGFVPMQVIRGTDFERVRFGDLSTLPIRYIREDIAGRKAIKTNDVLIETAGGTKDQPTGRTVHINDRIIAKAKLPMICASFARFLRPDMAAVDPGYLFWKLQAEYHSGALRPFHIQHTGVARFQYTQFATSYPILFPDDLGEQRRTAEILSQLDNKIELNRRMNETLEGMAQAIFRDWFVDFGPVRRAQAGATDPVAIMGGLTPDPARAAHLAAVFPAASGNDGLPVGWNEGSLARLALVNSESWKASNHPAEVEYVDLSNTKWGTIEATARLTWEAAPSRARRIARKGDSIIGTVRPGNGSYAYIGRDGFTVSTGFAVLRPKQAIYTDAIYVAATAADNITRLANLADGHGGAYPAVNPDVVAATPFPVVPDALLTAFSTFASPLREKIEQAKLENTTLAETRDYLLPRLMSGAVRVVPQAEAA